MKKLLTILLMCSSLSFLFFTGSALVASTSPMSSCCGDHKDDGEGKVEKKQPPEDSQADEGGAS